jgi:hypothetical protein
MWDLDAAALIAAKLPVRPCTMPTAPWFNMPVQRRDACQR